MGMFNPTPPTVNFQGETLDDAYANTQAARPSGINGFLGKRTLTSPELNDPTKRATLLFNWFTGGGLPKKVDPAKIFQQAEQAAPNMEKAAFGMGEMGLFGAGPLVGDLTPKVSLQSGVPYSTPAVPKVK